MYSKPDDFSNLEVNPTVDNMKIFDKTIKILLKKLRPIILSDRPTLALDMKGILIKD